MKLFLDTNIILDAVQYCAAQNITSDYIITRNTKDFIFSSISVYTPEEFLNQIIN